MQGPNIIRNPAKYRAGLRRVAEARRRLQAHLGRTRSQKKAGQEQAARQAYVWREYSHTAGERYDPKEVSKKFELRRTGWITD